MTEVKKQAKHEQSAVSQQPNPHKPALRRRMPFEKKPLALVCIGIGLIVVGAITIYGVTRNNDTGPATDSSDEANIERLVSQSQVDTDYYQRTIGEYEKTSTELQDKADSKKTNAEKLQNAVDLATLYYKSGQYDKAIESYELAKSLVPKSAKDYATTIQSYDLLINGVKTAQAAQAQGSAQ